MIRIISGVILGYLIFGIAMYALFHVTHRNPHAPASMGFEISAIVYGILFALLAGYVARFIGGSPRMMAVNLVALIVAVCAIVALVMDGIEWSAVAALAFMVPAVLIGGRLRMRRDNY